MKKFISALASLAIAATAMGGSFALSSSAINESVSESIIDIRSGGKNEIEAKAGDTIKVEAFLPQSAGFNSIAVTFAINDGQPAKTLKTTKGNIPFSFQNYGFKMENGKYPIPFALDSGYTTYKKLLESDEAEADARAQGVFAGAGFPDATQFAQFSSPNWTMFYQASHATTLEEATNIDAFGAWLKAGGDLDAETFDYSKYTPAYTWTKSESWAYDTPLCTFDIKVPSDVKDGIYKLGAIDGMIVGVTSIEKAATVADAGTTYDMDAENQDPKLFFNSSLVSNGVGGDKKVTVVPLTIKIGDVTDDPGTDDPGTDDPGTDDPGTSDPGTDDPGTDDPGTSDPGTTEGKVRYDLTAEGSTFSNGANTVEVEPGSKLTVNFTIQNDQGTAGMQYYFDFSDIVTKGGSYDGKSNGTAYRGLTVNANDKDTATTGRFDYVWAGAKEQDKAKDGAILYKWNFTTPTKEGTYKIGLLPESADVVHQTVPLQKGVVIPHEFYGLNIVVKKSGTDDPGTDDPGTDDPGTDDPGTDDPGTDDPGTDDPGTDDPGTDDPGTGDVVWGDTNCDGKVSIADVVLLNKGLANADNIDKIITAQGQKNADVVNDGTLKTDDSTGIKKYLAKLQKTLPIK